MMELKKKSILNQQKNPQVEFNAANFTVDKNMFEF